MATHSAKSAPLEDDQLPLSGIRVIEFSHMVMGPTVGLILGDLGAEVIKVEPSPNGDNTRRLTGSGAGFFGMFNRNKKSLCVDLKDPRGMAIVKSLIKDADVLIENFRPGALEKLGLGADELRAEHPELIYYSAKGFLPGPYEQRTALDEVVQMMAGLAYMTGPPGRPLRAGSSVNDIMGGMFGVIGILAALRDRDRRGGGRKVTSALFENCVFLSGQHMAQFAVTGQPAKPMPDRLSAWAIYDVFDCQDDRQIFVGVVSDTQWQIFCKNFDLPEFLNNPEMATNPQRCALRSEFLPRIRQIIAAIPYADMLQKCEELGLPFAPISRPEDLFDDPQLKASGGLITVQHQKDKYMQVPALPLTLDDWRPNLREDVPLTGEHSHELAEKAGLSAAEIAELQAAGILAKSP
jgi:crotonobetainyl-CoA:carnitine CoA-transferase CaiB-like acyl-CoA transferase